MNRIGIIGFGNIGRHHYKSINTNHLNFSGIYDLNVQNKERISIDAFFEDYESLLKISDSIVVSTPNSSHFELVKEIIKHGKNVLCEKPMCISLSQAEFIYKKDKEKMLKSVVGYNYRFLSVITILKEMIKNKYLGDIIYINLEFKKDSAIRRKIITWRDAAEQNKTSGALGDLGSHLIDLLHFLFDSKIVLKSISSKIKTNIKQKKENKVFVDDYAMVIGKLVSGINFKLLASKSEAKINKGFLIEVIGLDREFRYGFGKRNTYQIRNGKVLENFELPDEELCSPEKEVYGWSDSLSQQMKNWDNYIKEGELGSLCKFQEALEVHKVIQYILR